MNSPEVFKGKCRKITEGKVEGEAVVTKDYVNIYLVDPERGTIIEEGHDLEGKKIAQPTNPTEKKERGLPGKGRNARWRCCWRDRRSACPA